MKVWGAQVGVLGALKGPNSGHHMGVDGHWLAPIPGCCFWAFSVVSRGCA